VSEVLFAAIGYAAMGGLTSGIYVGMANAQKKDASNSVLLLIALIWPFFLPLAIGAYVMWLIA